MNNALIRMVIFVFSTSLTMAWIRPNVMDEMGVSQVYGANKVKEIDRFYPVWEWEMALETFGALWVDYKEEYLKDEISYINLIFYYDRSDVAISSMVTLSEEDEVWLRIRADYDYEEKKLVYAPIFIGQGETGDTEVYKEEEKVNEYLNKYGVTREDVKAYQEYIVYDVAVKTWSRRYLKYYWLEKWKLKLCDTVDNTFQFPEE